MDTVTFKQAATDAIRYWERGRIFYNVVLAAVVLAVFAYYWADARTALTLDRALNLFALAIFANVAYCSAYPVDVFAQLSDHREAWRRVRWLLWTAGTALACVMAQFVARAMVGHPA